MCLLLAHHCGEHPGFPEPALVYNTLTPGAPRRGVFCESRRASSWTRQGELALTAELRARAQHFLHPPCHTGAHSVRVVPSWAPGQPFLSVTMHTGQCLAPPCRDTGTWHHSECGGPFGSLLPKEQMSWRSGEHRQQSEVAATPPCAGTSPRSDTLA